MTHKYILVSLVIFLACTFSHGQEEFNVQKLTPSALLPTGKWEIKSFNSNYTQTAYFNENGKRENNGGGLLYFDDGSIRTTANQLRNTFFTSTNQINYGLNSSVNIGLEFWVNSGALSSSEDSRFKAINFKQAAHTRTTLSYIGVKLKFIPIQSISNFSIQSAFLIPVGEDLESHQTTQPFVNWDNYTWMNQFFLDIPLADKWLLFANIDVIWGISRNADLRALRGNRFTIPVKALLNYFATPRLTLLMQTEYNRIWQAFGDEDTREVQGAYYFQLGPSVKYQLVPSKLEGELSYGYFLAGNNGQGAGNSLSLGIRLLL